MSSLRPPGGRLIRPSFLQRRLRRQYKPFHTTSSRSARNRSPYRSISQAELDRIEQAKKTLYSRYTQEELAELRSKYTPQQLASIVAAEDAIDLDDLSRARRRQDVLRPKIVDSQSYARIQPTIDKSIERLRGEWDNSDDNSKLRHHRALPDEDKKMRALFDIIVDPVDNPLDEIDDRRRLLEDAARNETKPPNPIHTQPKSNALAKLLGRADLPKNVQEFIASRPHWNAGKPIVPAKPEGDETPEEARKRREAYTYEEADPTPPDEASVKQDEEDLERLERMLRNVPLKDPPRLSTRQRLERALTWRNSTPEVAPEIPRIRDPKVEWDTPAEAEAAEETGAADDETVEALAALSKVTGQPVERLRRYRTKALVSHRVVNQTRLGKIASQYVLAVAGDGRGMVGLGEGKAAEGAVANRQANLNAIRNMRPIHRYEGRTVFGELRGKCGAVELTLSAAPPGFGLRCSSGIFEIARAAGLQDLGAKVHRSRNPMNVAKAVWQALCDQRDPEEVARARGLKLVDVRKVYYAGAL